jgi:MFS family permease
VIGPAIAGILVATIGEGWCFFANGASYIAVITGLLMMSVAPRPAVSQPGSPVSRIVEGFRFVIANPPIHMLLSLLGVVSITGIPYAVLMPIFAGSILRGGAKELSWLMGATGVGAITGALLLASRRDLKGLSRWVPASALTFGAALVAFASSRNLYLSMVLLVPVGFSLMLEMGCSNTLIQSMTPDHLRGRVMSVYSMMFMGLAPVGSLTAGAAAARVGAPVTVMAAGVLCAAAASIFWARLPNFRVEARRLIVAQQMAGDPPQKMTGGSLKMPAT